jgi:hypothetical protein
MTKFSDVESDIAETLEVHNETLGIHEHRLIVAEGKIYALTHMVRDLLSLVEDTEAVKSRLVDVRAEVRKNLAPYDDASTWKPLFFDTVCDFCDQLMPGTPQMPPPAPVRPKLALITGGRSDG